MYIAAIRSDTLEERTFEDWLGVLEFVGHEFPQYADAWCKVRVGEASWTHIKYPRGYQTWAATLYLAISVWRAITIKPRAADGIFVGKPEYMPPFTEHRVADGWSVCEWAPGVEIRWKDRVYVLHHGTDAPIVMASPKTLKRYEFDHPPGRAMDGKFVDRDFMCVTPKPVPRAVIEGGDESDEGEDWVGGETYDDWSAFDDEDVAPYERWAMPLEDLRELVRHAHDLSCIHGEVRVLHEIQTQIAYHYAREPERWQRCFNLIFARDVSATALRTVSGLIHDLME